MQNNSFKSDIFRILETNQCFQTIRKIPEFSLWEFSCPSSISHTIALKRCKDGNTETENSLEGRECLNLLKHPPLMVITRPFPGLLCILILLQAFASEENLMPIFSKKSPGNCVMLSLPEYQLRQKKR